MKHVTIDSDIVTVVRDAPYPPNGAITIEAPDEVDVGWTYRDGQWTAPSAVTGWPSVQQFLDAFTDAELATIGSSDNAQVKGLLIRLNGWRDIVHADDERIQLGLGLLVQLGLLTAERKAEILASATNL